MITPHGLMKRTHRRSGEEGHRDSTVVQFFVGRTHRKRKTGPLTRNKENKSFPSVSVALTCAGGRGGTAERHFLTSTPSLLSSPRRLEATPLLGRQQARRTTTICLGGESSAQRKISSYTIKVFQLDNCNSVCCAHLLNSGLRGSRWRTGRLVGQFQAHTLEHRLLSPLMCIH